MKPWEGAIKPFRIFGNLYFVGTRPASAHLIDTGEGLILIDSGYPQTLYLVMDSIREMGFNPREIKIILNSHGHYDHLGASRALAELTGAKNAIGEKDRGYADGTLDLTWARQLGYQYEEMFEPDILLRDGDVLRLGNTAIECVETPGHTPGTLSFFFDVTDGKRTFRAGMFGGAGVNSLKKAFLNEAGLPFSLRGDYFRSLERLKKERVELFLGNHVHNNHTVEKGIRLEEMRKAYAAGTSNVDPESEANPFFAPDEWFAFLEKCRCNLQKVCDDPAEQE